MKKHQEKKYSYNIGTIIRACGHSEDVGIIESSYGYEPTVRKWETNKLCIACNSQKTIDLNRKTDAMRQKAQEYCQEHNISEQDSNITAYSDSAEITIYIR